MLDRYKPTIQKIITFISDILDVDSAVIDQRGKLVVSTQRYLQNKGQIVHVPSVERVLTHGHYLVDKPGYMDSCSGCRFSSHCPAKLEVLNTITLENHPIGIISLTSFSREGQKRISSNITKYQHVLHEISEIIVTIIQEKSHNLPEFPRFQNAFMQSRHLTPQIISKAGIDPFLGTSKAIQNITNKLENIKNSSSTVLITGETGTGKGHIAKTIHRLSNRSSGPFISVNCASIPENLFESEVFGYEEGAFTGAKKGGKPGRFEMAEGGTLFLDEIGDMPWHMQPKLLQVLQESMVERIGGIRSIPINVRIIAATNQNLEELVQQKKFRADLFYRLQVIPINIPPLRQRKEDIVMLAENFLKRAAKRVGRDIQSFTPLALEALQTYSWPGNVRELENVIEYAVNMETGNNITVDNLSERITFQVDQMKQNMKQKVKNLQADVIHQALVKHGYSVHGKQAAAVELGIGIRTLYRQMKRHDIKKPN